MGCAPQAMFFIAGDVFYRRRCFLSQATFSDGLNV
jgi:hypothetical protein